MGSIKNFSKIGEFYSGNKARLLLVLLIPLVLLAPYIAGSLFSGDTFFTGYLMNAHDQNIYYSFMKQAQDGHIRFLNLSCDIPHEREYIHTLFLLLGGISGLLNLPLWLVYLVSKYIFSVLFGFAAWAMLKKVVSGGWITTGLLAVMLGSGFGMFGKIYSFISGIEVSGEAMSSFPGDLWMPEMTVWNSINYTPLFIWSYLLIVLIYGGIYLGEKKESFKPFLVSAGSVFLIGLSHSYDLVPIAFISFALFLLFRFFKSWPFKQRVFWGYSAYGVLFLATLLYQYYVLKTNAGFSLWAEKNVNLPPNFIVILMGFGLLSLGYVECILRVFKFKQMSLELKFMAIWLLLQTALMYSPFAFSRRFILGISVPLAVFFVLFLKRLANTKLPPKISYTLCGLLLCITFLTPAYQVAANFGKVVIRDSRFFYSQEAYSAYSYISNNLTEEDILLSGIKESNRALRFSSAPVSAGSTQQTPEDVRNKVEVLFSQAGGELDNFVQNRGISHILCNKSEHKAFLNKNLGFLSKNEVVFENNLYIVYEVM
ncbi:hypothetical protein [Sedimentisphaera salicampi]|uniref:hypothetical protein n=1 Tax=Sedimentisphaera salicampi TaxID=1941349 RepID=UPI000B9B063D|nr:hypothetical protein [Sedimentisphaera salicampi]OXU16087.1 hypothetical protein SMSP1_00256 [Sedimentisphaera salicampi]